MSTDPVRNADTAAPSGWNAYEYALNDPLRLYDRTGMLPESASGSGTGKSSAACETNPNSQECRDRKAEEERRKAERLNRRIEEYRRLQDRRYGYWRRVWANFKETNTLVPGVLAPTGLGALTAGKVAVDGMTPFRWVLTGFPRATQGVVQLSTYESASIVGAGAAVNFALTGATYEVGVGVGSLINAIPVAGTNQSIGDWWTEVLAERFFNE